MGANWDLPNCAWDGKACIVPVVQKFAKPLHVPVMNMGSPMGATLAAKILDGAVKK